MLPGYVYLSRQTQNHIHLGVVPTDGSSPTGFGSHGEPPYQIGHVDKRLPMFESRSQYVRSWNEVPHAHVPRNGGGGPIVMKHMKYELRVSLADFDLLTNLLKRYVYLVDNQHCADNQDHSPFVRIMWLDNMDYDSNLDPLLNYQIVSLTFLDADTVATNDI